MKKLMITAVLLGSLITAGYSQVKPEKPRKEGAKSERPEGEKRQIRTAEQRAQMSTDALDKKLGLTADQKAKVYAVNLERAQQMEKSLKTEREYRAGQMDKNKSVREASDKKLSKILTEEQRKFYENMKKQSVDRMKARRSAGPHHKVK